jgi:hypothetical protein
MPSGRAGSPSQRARTIGRYSTKPEITKKIVTPSPSRLSSAPLHPCSVARAKNATW